MEEGPAAATAYLSKRGEAWSGRQVVRAVHALSNLKRPKEAVSAASRFLRANEGDPSEPELLAESYRLLRGQLKRTDAEPGRHVERMGHQRAQGVVGLPRAARLVAN